MNTIDKQIRQWHAEIEFLQTAILEWMKTHPEDILLQLMLKYPTMDVLVLGADYQLYLTILDDTEIGLQYDDILEAWGCATAGALDKYKATFLTAKNEEIIPQAFPYKYPSASNDFEDSQKIKS